MKMTRLFAGALLAAVPLVAAPAAQGAVIGTDVPAQVIEAPAGVTQSSAAYAQTILTKVNELRASHGLKPLTRYVQLDAVAQDWSEQMAARNFMSHRPDRGSHYPAGASGSAENVAMRSGDAPGVDIGAMIFEQWLHSPRHYENNGESGSECLGNRPGLQLRHQFLVRNPKLRYVSGSCWGGSRRILMTAIRLL